MTTTDAPAPEAVRRLDSQEAQELAGLVAVFDDLQTVLGCCERLVEALARPAADPLLIESLWTLALLAYARCFAPGERAVVLTSGDVSEVQPEGEALAWHEVMIELRDHHAHPILSPRERYSVGVTQSADGVPSGVAITSVRQPRVDEVTVRQLGAICYALSGLVDRRVREGQALVFEGLKALTPEDLAQLVRLDVGSADTSA